jgi:hypothetical protein
MIRVGAGILVLGGCFAQLGGGGSITPHAPSPPSGDGGFGRVGIGVGWGNEYGTLQVGGDAMTLGGVAAIGASAQANIFIASEHFTGSGARGDAGWCAIARVFDGTAIGDSVGTAEFSIGAGFAGWGYKSLDDWFFDNVGLLLSAYRTTFADRDPMWSYGLSVSFAVDPVVLLRTIFREPR